MGNSRSKTNRTTLTTGPIQTLPETHLITGPIQTPPETHLTAGPILSRSGTHETLEQLDDQELDLVEVIVTLETSRMPEQTGNQVFDVIEVSAPKGAKSGIPFAVTVNGQTVMVMCPPNIKPGQKFTTQIPAQPNYHPLEAINVTKLEKNQGFMSVYGY
jgi:hypothetical protein